MQYISRQSISKEVLAHIEEQSKLEKASALDLIEIDSKKKKLQLIRRYTSHYLLGLKVGETTHNLASC